ncbi:MAG: T9SS type A sorting domain-containing protein [Bacteroidetes bacterium]|nr:T9SS type A sorting domain-containing protein [Bacteroidota bacterium]
MENSKLIIRIPEPCHEDWSNMLPDPKGKFCTSCSKSVVDFSNKNDTEIHTILEQHKGQQVCGRFTKTQINRPLNIQIDFNNLPKNVSTTKAFAMALFLVFGTFLFSCTDMRGQKVETIEVINNLPEERMMVGEIMQILPEDTMPLVTTPIQFSVPESHVAGGVSIEQVLPTIDSVVTVFESMMLGGLTVVEYVEEKDTSVVDSLKNTDASRLFDQPVSDDKQTDLSVYPNPCNGEFTIKYDILKRTDIKVDILDMKGAVIRTVVNVNAQFEGKYNIPVNAADLPNGIYIVNLINNGKRYTEKLIIER